MDFDFGVDGEDDSMFDFNRVPSKSGKSGSSTLKRKKRAFGNAFQGQKTSRNASRNASSIGSSIGNDTSGSRSSESIDMSSSVGSSSYSSSQFGSTKSRGPSISIDKSNRRSRSRMRRREEEKCTSNDDDEVLSARSHISSSSGASSIGTANFDSIATLRSHTVTAKSELSVRRGAGSSAYAVQDAGTYQMIHDECSYLCSTILSRTTLPSKAIDAASDLATLLSSRKTRSMLWQGGSHSRDDDNFVIEDNQRSRNSRHNHLSPSFSSEKPKKLSPIPKVWSSILEVLALAATIGKSFDNCSSSNSSISSTTTVGSTRAPVGQPPAKYRTKSARRKEKELLQTGGCTIGIPTQTAGTANKYYSVTSKDSELNPDMKDVLACILYFVSWDCTMSGEHSIAAMGAVKSSAAARRIRLAILERGTVLNGVLRLMIPSQPVPVVVTGNSSRQVVFPSKILPATTKISDPPISPLCAPTSSIPKRSLRSASMTSSLSTEPVLQHTADGTSISTIRVSMSLSSKVTGDPTAMGRRKRKNRRKLKEESAADDLFHNTPLEPINTYSSLSQQAEFCEDSKKSKTMPPPSNRSAILPPGSDELSFADVSVQNQPARSSRKGHKTNDDGSSIISEPSRGGPSIFTNRLVQKIDSLRAKVHIESSAKSGIDITEAPSGCSADSHESIYFRRHFLTNDGIVIEGDRPWLSIVCLESLSRILTGKELDGKTSCLEGGEVNDDIDTDDDSNNVVMVTNRLVGKSGIIPLLSYALSQSMAVATKLIFGDSCLKNIKENSKYADEEYWVYCFDRLKLLASIIDEACFFSERNRRSFCEDDPFSFQDQQKGLIHHILIFLQECSNCNLNQLDQKRSETMSLALRTLTSLTHDNSLAAQQMKRFSDRDAGFNKAWDTDGSNQGIQVLANLVFQLEESSSLNPTKSKRASDHDMHQYDGTIFCLTTLANITEGAGIGRMLMENKLVLHSGKTLSWLKWLCQWLVKQTETFRQEILSIGNTKKVKRDSIRTSTADIKSGVIHQDEEEKLVAAGNGCVVLACLITNSDDGDPEASINVRNLIKNQMPLDSDGNSSGLSLVINTLKAYCNYYHMSMGEMSVAVVSPVRKLINELEEIAQVDEDQFSDSCDK